MKILLRPNLDKQNGLLCTQKTVEILVKLGIIPMLDIQHREYIDADTGCVFGNFLDMLPDCDVLMPIGGDGTIMGTAPFAVSADKPIVGVNAGRVGFLAQLELHELHRLERLVTGDYMILHRMMLELLVPHDKGATSHVALNDIVIRHGDADRIVDIEVRHQNKLIVSHRADGLIFSTPTGSTAYSLSAGGPIVSPELSLILMTVICPQSALNNSLVLPPDNAYTVREVPGNNQSGLYLSVDGQRVGKLVDGQAVVVKQSATHAKFIDLGLRDFYSNLNEKLSRRR